MEPEFERLAKEYDSALFYRVDIDECTELAIRDGIAAIPTFVLYKNQVTKVLFTKYLTLRGLRPALRFILIFLSSFKEAL